MHGSAKLKRPATAGARFRSGSVKVVSPRQPISVKQANSDDHSESVNLLECEQTGCLPDQHRNYTLKNERILPSSTKPADAGVDNFASQCETRSCDVCHPRSGDGRKPSALCRRSGSWVCESAPSDHIRSHSLTSKKSGVPRTPSRKGEAVCDDVVLLMARASSPAVLLNPMVLMSAPVAKTRRKKAATSSFHIMTADGKPEIHFEDGQQVGAEEQKDTVHQRSDIIDHPITLKARPQSAGSARHPRGRWVHELEQAPSGLSPRPLSGKRGNLTPACTPAPRSMRPQRSPKPPPSPKTVGVSPRAKTKDEGKGWKPGDARADEGEPAARMLKIRRGAEHSRIVQNLAKVPGSGLRWSSASVPRAWWSGKPLSFDSDFESGNLQRAVQVGDFEYDLFVRPDTNTKRHGQWFYFRIRGMESGVRYRVNIVNMQKADSLFTKGLRPVCLAIPPPLSKRAGRRSTAERREPQWMPAGEDIQWSKSRGFAETGAYALSLTLHASDTPPHQMMLAHSFPYTFTDLRAHLDELLSDPDRAAVVTRKSLCQTEGGLDCPLLEVSNPGPNRDARRIVFVSARVHPGETPSSWVMLGLLAHLTSQDPHVVALRERCLFLVVPMLNPDGVVHGNTRCSLSGHDLNRCWSTPKPRQHAPILAAKQLLAGLLAAGREVRLFLDLHAHSIKRDVFVYGCTDSEGGSVVSKPTAQLLPKVFPAMLHAACRFFNMQHCKFHHQAGKDACGRVVAFSELNIKASYTIETSFYGGAASDDDGQGCAYTSRDYQEVGRDVVRAMQDLFSHAAVLRTLRQLSAGPAERQSHPDDSAKHEGGGKTTGESEGVGAQGGEPAEDGEGRAEQDLGSADASSESLPPEEEPEEEPEVDMITN